MSSASRSPATRARGGTRPADAIYSALVDQIARLRPAPAFFVNLGVRVIQAFDRAGATTSAF